MRFGESIDLSPIDSQVNCRLPFMDDDNENELPAAVALGVADWNNHRAAFYSQLRRALKWVP